MKITLANIAAKTGVTISTVQRALNGGGGVSNENRAKIQKMATELGYKRNFYASNLRRGFIRIAVVFPDRTTANKFFSNYLWAGVERYLNESNIPYLEPVFISYDRHPEDQKQRLQEILEKKHGKIDGVVTRGSTNIELMEQVRQLESEGVSVVLASGDTTTRDRLCCVSSYEEMTGRLVADLLLNFGALEERRNVIACGSFIGLNQYNNAQGFERHFWESGLHISLMKVANDVDIEQTCGEILALLKNNPNVGAIYACSTRSTLSACEAVERANLIGKVRVIGSDLFEESAHLLRTGRLSAIVHNRPATVAYCAIQTLVDYLLNESDCPSDTILISSVIVMKGNLDFYLNEEPTLKKSPKIEKLFHFDDGTRI